MVPGVVIVKHTNPCGAAERPSLLEAWSAALEADPISAFGGVVALTREVDATVAEALTSIFLEIVIAPAFTAEALAVLATKPNLRVLVDEALAVDEPIAGVRGLADRVAADRRRRGPGHRPRHRRGRADAPGPAPRVGRRPTTSSSTWTSPGASSAA